MFPFHIFQLIRKPFLSFMLSQNFGISPSCICSIMVISSVFHFFASIHSQCFFISLRLSISVKPAFSSAARSSSSG